ncbi:MAG: hypothetical protein ACU85E_05285 [Gammaproteobacteria bacterium]
MIHFQRKTGNDQDGHLYRHIDLMTEIPFSKDLKKTGTPAALSSKEIDTDLRRGHLSFLKPPAPKVMFAAPLLLAHFLP